MFAEKFSALMNIAEVSNSMLGRAVNMNSSHIGRLRSGARTLPKKNEYLGAMCQYLAAHIKKEYQIYALQKLTAIGSLALESQDVVAAYLEQWLLEENDTSAATGRLISGFSRLAATGTPTAPERRDMGAASQKYASHLYGNAGKRKAVEQFFMMILQEDTPRTLFLFSDEDMAWLYEDPAFAARWAELFTQVLLRGNKVRMIHNVDRNLNEMLEAVTKWIPIYMTGMIEPYCYPRLRDGVFQRTLFIAPNIAAVISTSVQHATDGMLNLFITDRAAVEAIALEYERLFSMCRPLMRIFKSKDAEDFRRMADKFRFAEGAACIHCAVPPLFAMPEELMRELAEKTGNEFLPELWKNSFSAFQQEILHDCLYLILKNPSVMQADLPIFRPPLTHLLVREGSAYSREQYLAHIEHLLVLERSYANLKVRFREDIPDNMLLYVKDEVGVIMVKTDEPATAFAIHDRNMTNAFWDYLMKL